MFRRQAEGGKAEPDVKPIAVHELAAADARLKAAQQPWFDSLSEDERQALAAYKGRAGRAMNRALSGEPERQDLIVSAGYLRAALARACAPADMLVYRGVGQAEAAHYRALAQGYTVQARAFVSTSLSAEQAARSAQVQGGSVVELVIRRGRKGVAYVNPFPTYRYPQFEVLVNAGSVLKMLRANDAAIRLEVGPPGDWR
jgi:hypothetical protein